MSCEKIKELAPGDPMPYSNMIINCMKELIERVERLEEGKFKNFDMSMIKSSDTLWPDVETSQLELPLPKDHN